jgi:hypothetical protein
LRKSLHSTPQQKERQVFTKPQKLLRHEQQVLFAPLVNTYSFIEEWNRKRLAFIRANHILDGDAAFVEYLRGKIYLDLLRI